MYSHCYQYLENGISCTDCWKLHPAFGERFKPYSCSSCVHKLIFNSERPAALRSNGEYFP